MKVLALDPGGTTGWAMYSCEEIVEPFNSTSEFYNEKWVAGQLDRPGHHEQLYTLLELMHADPFHVVTESFEFRQRARNGLVLISLEYIGVAELFCQQRQLQLKRQTASMAKGFVTDDKIKNMELWKSGQPHAMDATRHLLYYLVNKCGRYDLLEKMSPPS